MRRIVKPENQPTPATLKRLKDAVGGKVEGAAPTVVHVHELSLTHGLELVLMSDGTVRWQRMGDDE